MTTTHILVWVLLVLISHYLVYGQQPVVSISPQAVDVNENAGTVTVRIHIDTPQEADFRVYFDVEGITATSIDDFYYPPAHTYHDIPAGDDFVDVPMPITPDEIVEGNETFSITLKDDNAYTIEPGQEQSIITIWETVSVDGGWSEWTNPSSDSCELCTDILESFRTCNNPPPIGDGAPCEGPSTRPFYCYDEHAESGCSFEIFVKMLLSPGTQLNVAVNAVKNRIVSGGVPVVLPENKKMVTQQNTVDFRLLLNPSEEGCDFQCIYESFVGFDMNPIMRGVGEILYVNIFPEDTLPPVCINERRQVFRFNNPTAIVEYGSSGAPGNECSSGVLTVTGNVNVSPRRSSLAPVHVFPRPISSFNLSMYIETFEDDGQIYLPDVVVTMNGLEIAAFSVTLINNVLYFIGERWATLTPTVAGEWTYFEVTVANSEIFTRVGDEINTFPLIDNLLIVNIPAGPSQLALKSIGFSSGKASGFIVTTVCEVDGWLAPGEECDDGNDIDDDGCSNSCKIVQQTSPGCQCNNEYTIIHTDRPSWMNEEPPSLAEDATEIFNVECPNNAECCITIQRPYVRGGVWSIGGYSLRPGFDLVPVDLPPESTDFQDDIYFGWNSNNPTLIDERDLQGSCFERIKANAPSKEWNTYVDGCNLVQEYCFNPVDRVLPFQCSNHTSTSESTGLPILSISCDIYLDLLRPKNSNNGNPEWPTTEFLIWGNRLHTDIVIDMGVVVTSDLDYITPYINTQVDDEGYLVGNVELDSAGTNWRALQIIESKLGSWDSEINGDGTNSTNVVQVDELDRPLGYSLILVGRNIQIKSNSVRNLYRDTIYLRVQVINETDNSLSTVTLKVEIKARNIIVDKSQNPIGLNIQPVVKVLQRDVNNARDFNLGTVPSFPVFSIEDIFVMEIPKTDNQNLRLSTITSTLYRTNDEGEIVGDPVQVLIDRNQPITSPLWEFEYATDSYIASKDISTAYSFRLAVESGSYAIVQVLIFEVHYASGSSKMNVQQITKPASVQTTTLCTVSVGVNGQEVLQVQIDNNEIESNMDEKNDNNNDNDETSTTVGTAEIKPSTVGTTNSDVQSTIIGVLTGIGGVVILVGAIATVVLLVYKSRQPDLGIENKPLTPRSRQQQLDSTL